MAEHTRGPWEIFNGEQVAPADALPGDEVTAVVEGAGLDGEQAANARLIAAAPEMLAALKAAKYALEEVSVYVDYGSTAYEIGGDAYSQINEAMQKAEGE